MKSVGSPEKKENNLFLLFDILQKISLAEPLLVKHSRAPGFPWSHQIFYSSWKTFNSGPQVCAP